MAPALCAACAALAEAVLLLQDLEREASFQGGSGLYYHYYKRLLAAPSFSSGTDAWPEAAVTRCDPP